MITNRAPFLLLSLSLLLASATSLLAQENNKAPEGYTAIFNGEDLSGWYGMNFSPVKLAEMSEEDRKAKLAKQTADMREHWSVENGELVNDGKGAYLTTEKDYGDYDFWIDYKTVADADSGIYLRATPQVQIWDYTEAGGKWNIGADKGSGGLWNNSKGAPGKDPAVLADKPFGEWNRLRIRQVGARTSVWLNGKLVVDHATMENYWARDRALFRTGPIQLQTHGGEIRWRNVFIREIGSDEANELLKSKGDDGFVSIFNGKDFTGWKGPTDNYEINDGVLKCKEHKGGTIFTEKEYSDFVARMEFKLPPGGNNGLAIRYPGKGDTAYGGMCELQVLDSEHPKYAKLDKRQYHGSAYGMIPATRGYLRPTGDWNFQEVTVKGSTIKVELNGSVILDGDVSKVTEFMANSPHPGKDLLKGHFGFAGHNDPVEYRNVSIKELKSDVAKVEAAKLGATVNVHRVGNIFLAGQPKPDDLETLKGAGIKHVLNLRNPKELRWDEPSEMKKAGFDYTSLAFAAPNTLTDSVFDTARETFRSASADGKVMCHCGSANRVGGVWLAYRVLDDGVDWDVALEEAKTVGLRTPAYVDRARDYIKKHSAN